MHGWDLEHVRLLSAEDKDNKEKEFFNKYMPDNKFIEGTEYANFASRNILVPRNEFTEMHSDKLKMLQDE